MNTESVALVSSTEGPSPLAFEFAVAAETPQGAMRELISTPTGGGYPPEDDPA